MKKRALIFDFDGLILDTEGAKAQAWREIFRQEGVELDFRILRESVGTLGLFSITGKAHLEELLGRPVDWPPLADRFRKLHHELISQSPLLPGVAGLIDRGADRGY